MARKIISVTDQKILKKIYTKLKKKTKKDVIIMNVLRSGETYAVEYSNQLGGSIKTASFHKDEIE